MNVAVLGLGQMGQSLVENLCNIENVAGVFINDISTPFIGKYLSDENLAEYAHKASGCICTYRSSF